MRKQYKKLIAPIIVTVLLIIYFGCFLRISVMQPITLLGKLIFIIVPLSLIGVSIFVLVERIKEVRSGEEDDLSKY